MSFEEDIKLFCNAAVSILIAISVEPVEVVSENTDSPCLPVDSYLR